jgi:class 3 adenylate cyclase
VRDVRYARSGEVDIAYEITGEGRTNLVYVPGFISHIDLQRELPAFATVLSHFERFARLLVFDKRGTGCSERNVGFGSLADRADDIRAVMDDAGWERAHLFGVSEGGPLSILFAASNPDRVASLSLYGTFARLFDPLDPATAAFDVERYLDGLVRHWGDGSMIARFIDAPYDRATQEAVGRYERACASPKLVREIMRSNFLIDIRAVCPAITVPTLVMHCTGDPVVPIARSRELARLTTGARFVEIDGAFHSAWQANQWAPILDRVEEFVTGAPPGHGKGERALATVLFTDIVGSTERAASLGDRAWRALLDEHDAEIARHVERYDGVLVKHTGDGALATFDGPARAVRCAQDLSVALAGAGVPVRAGVHTGEVERRGDDIGGIAVHIAARVAALAEGGEVLVSRTVRDLVVGSDLAFDDHGTHTLKGVPEPWQIYRAS